MTVVARRAPGDDRQPARSIPVEAQPRQVFFFDTPDLRLNQAGVVVRARRIQGGRGDTVVKLRPVVPDELPQELRRSPSFNVEVDVLPGLIGVCSASLKGRASGAEIRDAVRGDIPLRKLFTKDQRAFYKEHAPADIDLDALQVLGPTFILKSVFQATSIVRRFVAEAVVLPGRHPDPRAVDQVPAERGRDRGAPRPGRTSTSTASRSEPARSRRRPRRPSSSSAPSCARRAPTVRRHRPRRGGDRRRWRGPVARRRRGRLSDTVRRRRRGRRRLTADPPGGR